MEVPCGFVAEGLTIRWLKYAELETGCFLNDSRVGETASLRDIGTIARTCHGYVDKLGTSEGRRPVEFDRVVELKPTSLKPRPLPFLCHEYNGRSHFPVNNLLPVP